MHCPTSDAPIRPVTFLHLKSATGQEALRITHEGNHMLLEGVSSSDWPWAETASSMSNKLHRTQFFTGVCIGGVDHSDHLAKKAQTNVAGRLGVHHVRPTRLALRLWDPELSRFVMAFRPPDANHVVLGKPFPCFPTKILLQTRSPSVESIRESRAPRSPHPVSCESRLQRVGSDMHLSCQDYPWQSQAQGEEGPKKGQGRL